MGKKQRIAERKSNAVKQEKKVDNFSPVEKYLKHHIDKAVDYILGLPGTSAVTVYDIDINKFKVSLKENNTQTYLSVGVFYNEKKRTQNGGITYMILPMINGKQCNDRRIINNNNGYICLYTPQQIYEMIYYIRNLIFYHKILTIK